MYGYNNIMLRNGYNKYILHLNVKNTRLRFTIIYNWKEIA